MSFNSKLYKDYEEKLYSLSDGTIMTDKLVNELYDNLLAVLPNGGKLYKYKALEGFHIDELEEKYIWFSSAKNLNDNKDCAFNANSLKQMEELVKFFLTDNNYRKTLVGGLHLNLSRRNPEITHKVIEDCLNCIKNNGERIGKLKFDKFCRDYKLTREQRQELWKTIQLYSDERQNETAIRNSIRNFYDQTKKLRSGNQICSLTTSYKKDSMWAYYCNNKGICLEYDFTKINTIEAKKIFINTQKVRYGRKKKFSYVEIMKAKLENSPEALTKADKMIFEQLLTKDKSWLTEEEWRVITHVRGNEIGIKVPADIVSAIYIDYSVLEEEKAKRIIELAKLNDWKIYVRYFIDFEAEYRYDTIENTNKLIAKTKELLEA